MIVLETTLLGIQSGIATDRIRYWFRSIFNEKIFVQCCRNIEEIEIVLTIEDEHNSAAVAERPIGPSKPRIKGRGKVFGLYLQMSFEEWKGLSPETVLENFISRIRQCFYLLVDKLEEKGELIIQKEILVSVFEDKLKKFKSVALKPKNSGEEMSCWESDRYRELKEKGIIT